MLNSSFQLRELFHLNLLHYFGLRFTGRSWAVKGGIALRFFHRSPRLSEDMDIDISPQVRKDTIEKAMDSILMSRSFRSPLLSRGIIDIKVTKPKQTEMTQRWKCSLMLSQDVSLPTKVEFSRRKKELRYSTGIPNAQILTEHKMFPFAVQYCDAKSMAVQKILALASPTRNAARDLFDLYHLFLNSSIKPAEVHKLMGESKNEIEHATAKVSHFSYVDFKEQVLPFLTESMSNFFKDEDAFINLKLKVEDLLLEVME